MSVKEYLMCFCPGCRICPVGYLYDVGLCREEQDMWALEASLMIDPVLSNGRMRSIYMLLSGY